MFTRKAVVSKPIMNEGRKPTCHLMKAFAIETTLRKLQGQTILTGSASHLKRRLTSLQHKVTCSRLQEYVFRSPRESTKKHSADNARFQKVPCAM
jgi:hypothetical protein